MSTEPIEFSDTPLWTQFNSGAHKLSDDACTNFSSLLNKASNTDITAKEAQDFLATGKTQ